MASSKAKKIIWFFILLILVIAGLAIFKVFQIRGEIAAFAKNGTTTNDLNC